MDKAITVLFKGEVRTQTGSIYQFYTGQGRWLVKGDNIVSSTSKDIKGRLWPIEKPDPWPPVLGESLMFISLHFHSDSDEDRIPGGGKHTSLIESYSVTVDPESFHYE